MTMKVSIRREKSSNDAPFAHLRNDAEYVVSVDELEVARIEFMSSAWVYESLDESVVFPSLIEAKRYARKAAK